MESNIKQQIDNREIIGMIANSDIPVDETCLIYQIFFQRKIAAQNFNKTGNDVYIDYVEQCNIMIKEYFGLW